MDGGIIGQLCLLCIFFLPLLYSHLGSSPLLHSSLIPPSFTFSLHPSFCPGRGQNRHSHLDILRQLEPHWLGLMAKTRSIGKVSAFSACFPPKEEEEKLQLLALRTFWGTPAAQDRACASRRAFTSPLRLLQAHSCLATLPAGSWRSAGLPAMGRTTLNTPLRSFGAHSLWRRRDSACRLLQNQDRCSTYCGCATSPPSATWRASVAGIFTAWHNKARAGRRKGRRRRRTPEQT